MKTKNTTKQVWFGMNIMKADGFVDIDTQMDYCIYILWIELKYSIMSKKLKELPCIIWILLKKIKATSQYTYVPPPPKKKYATGNIINDFVY